MYDILLYLLDIELVRFLLGGGIVTAVYYAIYLTLVERRGVYLVTASWIAFFPSLAINFAIQKLWTFQNPDAGAAWWQFALFAVKYFVLQNANAFLIRFFAERWGFTPRRAQLLATAILTIISYVISHFIFKT